MQTILYCDKKTDCIPVRDCPEGLLKLCNIPLIEYLLQYIQQKGFQKAVLLAPDERIRNLVESLHLTMPVYYARSLASLHADMPTLLLRKLCVPDWDMAELFSLGKEHSVRLFHADNTPAFAELHPLGSVLLEPELTAVCKTSVFEQIRTPAEYRNIQQKLISRSRIFKNSRIGEGVSISNSSFADETSVIGNDCIIGENSRIENSCLGSGVQIGKDVILKDCVICRKAFIDSGTHLENAVIPENTILYPDSGTAKLRSHFVHPDDGISEGLPRWNTAETALKAGSALTVLSRNILIGYHHKNAEASAIASASGAVSHGASVWLAGECSLSQLIYLAELVHCPVMLWIQGEQDILLKPCLAGGFPLSEQQSDRLRQALEANTFQQILKSGSFHNAETLHTLWEESCKKILPVPEYEITVSCSNQQLRHTAQMLFSGGTGQRITLSLSEDGTKVSAFSSESGMLRHEQLLLLALLAQDTALAVPEEFHLSGDSFAEQHHKKILRVSSPEDPSAELYRKQGICTDGIKLFCYVLKALHEQHLTLAEASAMLPPLCTVQHEISTSLTRQTIEKIQQSNSDSRIRIVMPPYSKLVRLRVHADSVETAAELCGFWEKKLRLLESEEL